MKSRLLFACFMALYALNTNAGESLSPASQIVNATGIKAGVMVHLGCSDGLLTSALSENGNFLVQGFASDDATVLKIRATLQAKNVYGHRISIERGDLASLPYANNLVNIVVVDKLTGAIKKGLKLTDVMRVLCPNGIFIASSLGEDITSELTGLGFKDIEPITIGKQKWLKARKPKPNDIGEWNHWRCDAGENPVTRDARSGYPKQLQWVAAPKLSAGHKPATVAVSANGRLFYTVDETYSFFDGETLPAGARMTLVARDGYNGMLLWKKALPGIGLRNIVAHGKNLYTVLEGRGPCVALDAETGKVNHTFEGTAGTASIRFVDGILLLTQQPGRYATAILAIDASSGKQLWKHGPGSHLAGDGRVFVKTKTGLIGLDLKTGSEIWKTELTSKKTCAMSGYHAGVLVLMENPGRGDCILRAYSASDGKPLWTKTVIMGNGYRPVQQLTFMKGLLYAKVRLKDLGAGWLVLDAKTGEEKSRMGGGGRGAGGGKCTTETAALNFFFKGSKTIALDGTAKDYGSFRSGCKPGTVPSNGMMYYLPADCSCSPFKGTFALLPGNSITKNIPVKQRLETGKSQPPSSAAPAGVEDWPTFLHDNSRGGVASTNVPAEGKLLWSAKIEARSTAPVVAANTVFVGTKNHQVLAFDAVTGKKKWSFTTGGPVNASPTYHNGLCLVGCNDGYVYALNASSGAMLWRMHVAPLDRKLVAFEHFESAWPVNTGVTIFNNQAYFFAGRMGNFDGYHTVVAEPQSGKLIWEQRAGLTAATTLSANAQFLYFCSSGSGRYTTRIDPKNKKVETIKRGAPKGLLNRGPNAELHGKVRKWSFPGAARISAERLVFSKDTIFGAQWRARSTKAQLFKLTGTEKKTKAWNVSLSGMRAEAMIQAGSTIFVAGQVSVLVKKKKHFVWKKTRTGVIRAFNTEDGKLLNSWKLPAPPVFNSLAAAGGRLYVSTIDGQIRCFGN